MTWLHSADFRWCRLHCLDIPSTFLILHHGVNNLSGTTAYYISLLQPAQNIKLSSSFSHRAICSPPAGQRTLYISIILGSLYHWQRKLSETAHCCCINSYTNFISLLTVLFTLTPHITMNLVKYPWESTVQHLRFLNLFWHTFSTNKVLVRNMNFKGPAGI